MTVCQYSRSRCALALLLQFAVASGLAIAQQQYAPSPSPSSRGDDPGASPPRDMENPRDARTWPAPPSSSSQRNRFDASPRYAPPNDGEHFQPTETGQFTSAGQHPGRDEERFPERGPIRPVSHDSPRPSMYPLPGTAEPALHNAFPQDVAAAQVDWQQDNALGCEGQCGAGGYYSSYCDHCTPRWTLFPQSDRIRIGGWIDQGVTFNFNSPADRSNTRVFFNDRSNDYLLNQVYLYAEAPVCNDGSQWDIGGRIDVNYGRDSRFVTVPGLERHRDRTPKWNGENSLNGLALPQAYLEVAAPWMKGVSLKAGHFYANMGYERFAAPDNFFYSHSYSYIFGEPFTFTGALATIKPMDGLTFNVGYANGWDVWDSTSNEWGIVAGAKLATPDGRTSIGVQVYSGEDVTGVRVGNALVDERRTAWTLVFQHSLTERLRYVFQHDFGQQQDGRIIATIPTSTISFDTAKWYSINQYLFFEHTKELSSGLRVEWFRDQEHSRASIPVVFNPGGPVFTGGNYVAITAGLNWRPTSNVVVRPELRWDWSDLKGNPNVPGGDPAVRAFDDGTRSSQGTAALDVIFHY